MDLFLSPHGTVNVIIIFISSMTSISSMTYISSMASIWPLGICPLGICPLGIIRHCPIPFLGIIRLSPLLGWEC
jgi:hypothetical protein